MGEADLPAGWHRWSEEDTKVVLVYRPDVFDTAAFPAPCLPTIYLTKGGRGRRPGQDRPDPAADWYVTFFLEPEVNRSPEVYETREAALDGAERLARRFARGDVDYRALYQVPRDDYLDRLDDLTG
ncbi:MAG: DUF5820 family protein [Haloarculaceae archaeon]